MYNVYICIYMYIGPRHTNRNRETARKVCHAHTRTRISTTTVHVPVQLKLHSTSTSTRTSTSTSTHISRKYNTII